MFKKLLLSSSLFVNLFALDYNISANNWQFIGVNTTTSVSALQLNQDDTIWSYKSNQWYCYKKGVDVSNKCNQLETLAAGDGFWLNSNTNYTLSINGVEGEEKSLKAGWSMFSPVKSDLDTNTLDSYYSIWKYTDNQWYLKTPSNITTSLSSFDQLAIGEAAWINKMGDISFGNNESIVTNGTFDMLKVKYTSNDYSIFKLKIKVDKTALPTSTFDIGIKMNSVEFLLKDMTITTDTITQPTNIYVQKDTNIKSITPYSIVSFDSDYITINLESTYNQIIQTTPSYTPSLGDKTTTIVSDSLVFFNDKKNSSIINIASSNYSSIILGDNSHSFPTGSSLLEGVINLY